MKGEVNRKAVIEAHSSTFAALPFPDSKQIYIYCRVDRESFPVAGWPNDILATFYTLMSYHGVTGVNAKSTKRRGLVVV